MVELVVEGLGDNTLSLVRQACDLVQEGNYDRVWCVFDRDGFPADQFNAAFDLARQRGIQVAYSNPAFELWYLLHFCYQNVGLSRQDCVRLLSERLLKDYAPERRPEQDNPSTTVHLLVQELNRYVR